MDLLGSILNSMAKPPTVNEQQKKLLKSKPVYFCLANNFIWFSWIKKKKLVQILIVFIEQQEDFQKKQDEERTKLKKFREDVSFLDNIHWYVQYIGFLFS